MTYMMTKELFVLTWELKDSLIKHDFTLLYVGIIC